MEQIKHKPGVYETWYGNTVEYRGGRTGKDLDMGERIPVDQINFHLFVRKLD